MADRKLLYIDSDGFSHEHSESADSIKALSFKTATAELTDTHLAALVGGGNATTQHIHDDRYYRENEHVASSAGAGDAGKPVVLDAGGKFDETLIDVPGLTALIDHGGLAGLGDDDHTIYTKADGTRAFTGKVSYSSHPSFSSNTELVDKKYVDDAIVAAELGDEWQQSVITAGTLTPPGSPSVGDRYLINGVGAGGWATKDNQIAEYTAGGWVYTVPTTGTFVAADDEPAFVYYFGGSSWTQKSWEQTTASTGLVKVGYDIRLDASSAGAGLGFSAGVLAVNVDATTIEINSDTLRVKADGINDTHIDFGTGANQVSAVDLPIADAGSYFPTDNTEAALQALGAVVFGVNPTFTVGTGGVTKGDLLYVSANDTLRKFTTLSAASHCPGLAASTEAAAGSVRLAKDDDVLTGVLTGATAGDLIYWDGSAPTSTQPSTSGQYVWAIGVAKNATDMIVQVRSIKKNA